MYKKLAFAVVLVVVMVLTACGPAATPAPENTVVPEVGPSGVTQLTILWAQWAPADYLQQIGNLYEQATGIKVSIVQEPWGSFGDRFNVAMAAGGTEWDMVVGDSQWVGQGATAGYYMELTDFMKSNGIDTSVTPSRIVAMSFCEPRSWTRVLSS